MAVIAAAVASHLFNPTDWPPLGVDILHSLHGPGFALIALAVFWYLQSRCVSPINYLLAAGDSGRAHTLVQLRADSAAASISGLVVT